MPTEHRRLPTPVMPTTCVERIYKDVLHRTPEPGEFARHVTRLLRGHVTPDALGNELRASSEYHEIVRPALAEIQHVYKRFLFREPASREISRHMDCFVRAVPSVDERRRITRAGKVRQHLGIRPLSVEIDITTQCNIRCIMCYLSIPEFSKRKREDISVAEFDRIAAQVFPLCGIVALSSSVEPLLHPQFGEILSITKGYGVDHVTMTTNGLLFDDRRIDEFIDHRLDSMAISIDAATEPTYERLRKGGRFARLIENVSALTQAKRKHGSSLPWITFNIVLMRSNIAELPALVALAHELGVSGVCATHLTPYAELDLESESLVNDRQRCNEMLEQARSLAQTYGIAVSFPPVFEIAAKGDRKLLPLGIEKLTNGRESGQTKLSDLCAPIVAVIEKRQEVSKYLLPIAVSDGREHCLFPWHYAIIGPYGEVQPCGWWYKEPMGNIHEQSFEDIWNGERFQTLRAEHQSQTLNENCRTCPACGMGDVNSPAAFVAKPLLG
jgi:radical SAM protein with 4Fe4S-binding SPASM domain